MSITSTPTGLDRKVEHIKKKGIKPVPFVMFSVYLYVVSIYKSVKLKVIRETFTFFDEKRFDLSPRTV